MSQPLIFELSSPGRTAFSLPELDVPEFELPEQFLRKEPPNLPEVSELQLVRHYTNLSQKNYAIDTVFYPLGSCTMKYNPKVHETIATMGQFINIHPFQSADSVQGNLQLMYELQIYLAEIAGFNAISLQPAAGAQGEFAGVLVIRAYHDDNGDTKRTKMLIPDSAHGTNPATSVMAGYDVVELPSDARGNVDLESLKKACDETTAGLMITNPNTLGLFEEHIDAVIKTVHDCGGLVYGDGANLNALMGIVRPGDLGFDVLHFNLHKTFSTPHGGGGPGSGPIGVGERLAPFLPGPIVTKDGENYNFTMPEKSIGAIKDFWGNFGMFLRTYAYIRMLGADGLRKTSENAVLNANYLMKKLMEIKGLTLPFNSGKPRKHECVFSAKPLKNETGVSALNIAKRLLDYGLHAPTIYFPLIVEEALMIEPTETFEKEEIDRFVEAMRKICEEAYANPEKTLKAPHNTTIPKLDEVKASHPRTMSLSWRMYLKKKV